MEAAFGDRFGEAWTRSQCAGILPMAGVSLMLAREPRTRQPVGFSLFRSVADEAELLLLAVLPSHRRRGVGSLLLDDFVERARGRRFDRVHLEVRDGKSAIGMYRRPVSLRSAGAANIITRRTAANYDALTFAREL